MLGPSLLSLLTNKVKQLMILYDKSHTVLHMVPLPPLDVISSAIMKTFQIKIKTVAPQPAAEYHTVQDKAFGEMEMSLNQKIVKAHVYACVCLHLQ
jgi:hypothetical protein